MEYTLQQLEKMMRESGGDLDLRGFDIKPIPGVISVSGDLDLRRAGITALPIDLHNLHVDIESIQQRRKTK